MPCAPEGSASKDGMCSPWSADTEPAEQLDGGEEFRDAASVSNQLTNPLLSAGVKGAQYFKEKTPEERKLRIKVV